MQLTPDTERKVADLIEWGYGTRSDIIRLAISKFYDSEVAVKLALERMRKEEKREMDKELMESVYSLQRYRVTVKPGDQPGGH
jgi:Arc/MetJ-type ribon-helix-helix transcriptional regulator